MKPTSIKVSAEITASLQKVWDTWNDPKHIVKWNTASPDWHTPSCTNDFKVGGEIHTIMAAKDGSMEFDFCGTYTKIEDHELIESTLMDGRKMRVSFQKEGEKVILIEEFEPEEQNSPEMQKAGWQAILDSFKKYTESLA